MSTKFYPLRIREVRRETPDTVSLSFEVPVSLREKFQFTQGQYLTLREIINGEDVRRSYSICTGVQEGDLRVAIKKVPGGLFSTYANEVLQSGDMLEVMPPMGKFFTPLSPEKQGMYVAFAAGSGITPVLSILKTTLQTEPNSAFVLFCGNRNFENIIFREELESLKNLHPTRLSVHHILSRETPASPIFQGRINGEKCAAYARAFFKPDEVDAYFLCGPEDMIFSVKNTLESLGAPSERVHFELFTSPGSAKQKRVENEDANTGFMANIVILQDDMRYEFAVPSDGSNILDAATRAGADLPYACKGGVCSTCRAKIIEGEVEMDVCYGLEPDEIAKGYILTCQSHPKTATVVVSFDH